MYLVLLFPTILSRTRVSARTRRRSAGKSSPSHHVRASESFVERGSHAALKTEIPLQADLDWRILPCARPHLPAQETPLQHHNHRQITISLIRTADFAAPPLVALYTCTRSEPSRPSALCARSHPSKRLSGLTYHGPDPLAPRRRSTGPRYRRHQAARQYSLRQP